MTDQADRLPGILAMTAALSTTPQEIGSWR